MKNKNIKTECVACDSLLMHNKKDYVMYGNYCRNCIVQAGRIVDAREIVKGSENNIKNAAKRQEKQREEVMIERICRHRTKDKEDDRIIERKVMFLNIADAEQMLKEASSELDRLISRCKYYTDIDFRHLCSSHNNQK